MLAIDFDTNHVYTLMLTYAYSLAWFMTPCYEYLGLWSCHAWFEVILALSVNPPSYLLRTVYKEYLPVRQPEHLSDRVGTTTTACSRTVQEKNSQCSFVGLPWRYSWHNHRNLQGGDRQIAVVTCGCDKRRNPGHISIEQPFVIVAQRVPEAVECGFFASAVEQLWLCGAAQDSLLEDRCFHGFAVCCW